MSSVEPWTELDDRVLRFDGVSVVTADRVINLFLAGLQPRDIRVAQHDASTLRFNEQQPLERQIHEQELDLTVQHDMSWRLPAYYQTLDMHQLLQKRLRDLLPGLKYASTQEEAARNRVSQELLEFEKRGLMNLLRTIVYVLDDFRRSGQVYGVGRGSSCASYVLFLLGLHVVDPIRFSIPLSEFIHD